MAAAGDGLARGASFTGGSLYSVIARSAQTAHCPKGGGHNILLTMQLKMTYSHL
jgi:hypothetical protein